MKNTSALSQKIRFTVRALFLLALAETLIFAFIKGDYSNIINAFTAVLGFALTFIPHAIENFSKNRIRFSDAMHIAIVLFIFAANLLGEIRSFYLRFFWWDDMLHALSGIILGLIGFTLVYALNESAYVRLSPLFISAFAFFFALSCGALWEIFEFAGDRLLHMNMQKYLPPVGTTALMTDVWRYDAGLVDTMTDLILDALSALSVSILGYLKIRSGQWFKKK